MKKKIRGAIITGAGILALSAGCFSFFVPGTPGASAELRVMVSDGMKPVVEELTPQIERATGRKLAAEFNSSKNLRDKILAGEPFDAAIMTSDVVDALIQQGKIAAAGRAEIARTGMGVGVRAGAPKPDIATPEALKRTLLNAKSISFNPSGASAAHLYDMFARLGITDAVKPKLMLPTDAGRPQMNVAEGKAELVFSLVPEIRFFRGVDFVGPIPAEFQSYINFAGGIAVHAQDADGAKALIRFMTGPAVPPVLKAKGMEPH